MKRLGTAIAFLAVAAAASAQVPAGGEFRVNTYTTGNQLYPRAAMEPDGDFVVAWASEDQDGADYGIFGQRFAASGAPRGTEFSINVQTGYTQDFPDVAVGANGVMVVVWQGFDDGSSLSIQGRRFDAAGAAIGGEFVVNSFTTEMQYRPRVDSASDSGFVVTWTCYGLDGGSQGVAARRFDAAGTALGSDFVVNTYTTSFQVRQDIGVSAAGDFVVVWMDTNERDGSLSAVFGQRYDASGSRVGLEFQVNSYTTWDQGFPAVSVSPAGDFVVAWQSPQGIYYGVRAQRFDRTGSAVGNEFAVNTYTRGHQYHAQVAKDALGNFVVTWHTNVDPYLSTMELLAQRFSASGAPRGAEFRVSTHTTLSPMWPSVVSDSVGNFVVAWMDFGQDELSRGIYAQRFGGLAPAALVVDDAGNAVLEPGETVDVRPSWRNVNGAAQTFSGMLTNITGPAGATHTITDAAGDYGTVPDGATAPCADCYAVSVSNPGTRPAVHWDASAVESILPDSQGQQKQWLLHVGSSFIDVPTSSGFYRFIETLLHHGVTGGCSGTQYCPAASTTREQMAVFVVVAKEGTGYVPPSCLTPMFTDVPPSSPFCRWIGELARRGVVSGCGGGNYCPSNAVSREQMSVFVLRTLDPTLNPPACTTPLYNDVPASSPFCRWIEELTRRGVVTGCGGGNYCPAAAVTREQMGVFISVTFGLRLYGP